MVQNSPRVPQQVCESVWCCGSLWQTIWFTNHSGGLNSGRFACKPIDCFWCMTQAIQAARTWVAEGCDFHHEFQHMQSWSRSLRMTICLKITTGQQVWIWHTPCLTIGRKACSSNHLVQVMELHLQMLMVWIVTHWSMLKGTGPGRTRVGSLASPLVRRGTTLMNVQLSQVDRFAFLQGDEVAKQANVQRCAAHEGASSQEWHKD